MIKSCLDTSCVSNWDICVGSPLPRSPGLDQCANGLKIASKLESFRTGIRNEVVATP